MAYLQVVKVTPLDQKVTPPYQCSSAVFYTCLAGVALAAYYVSQFTVETYCFTDGRCLFKQPQSVIYHWNQYDEEISQKCRSVRRPSVCPFVTLTKKAYSSFIIDSREIIHISGERVWQPLQEKEVILSKKYF